MITRILLISSIFLFVSTSSQAQIFDKITSGLGKAIVDGIGDKVAEQLAQKLIEAIMSGEQAESQADSLSQYAETDTTQSSSSSSYDLGSLFGSSSSTVDKQYSFDYKVEASVVSGEQASNFLYYFPEHGTYVGSEMSSLLMVFDFESGESYTIVNDKLTSFNMKKVFEKNMVGKVDENGQYAITRTGNKKTIAGYSCEEYILDSDEAEIRCWITTDFISTDLNNAAMIKMIADENTQNLEKGFSMETISYDKENKTTTTMTITSVSKEGKVIDLSQY